MPEGRKPFEVREEHIKPIATVLNQHPISTDDPIHPDIIKVLRNVRSEGASEMDVFHIIGGALKRAQRKDTTSD